MQLRRGLVAVRSERRDAGSRRRIADPPPARHGHVRRRSRARLRIFERQPRTPLEIRDKCRPPLRIPRQSRLVRGSAHQGYPAGSLRLREALADVLRHHSRVTAIPFAVALRPAEDFAEPRSHSFRMVRRHVREQGTDQRILWYVLRIEQSRHPNESGKSSGPFEQRRLTSRVDDGIDEAHVPVHPAAERFVLRVAASAQAVMLERRALVSRNRSAAVGDERDAAGHPIRPILGNLDRRRANGIDLLASLASIDREAQRSRWTRLHGAHDLVHPRPARRDEWFLALMENAWQAVRAEARVRARAPVVENRELLARIDVDAIADTLWILCIVEPVAD